MLRERIADIIDGWGNISPHRRMQIATEILAAIREAAEEVIHKGEWGYFIPKEDLSERD